MRELRQSELASLDDDALVAYVVSMREAENLDAAELALKIFAFGMEAPLRAFVRTRLDSHGDTVIDEVAERALEDAVRSIATINGGTSAEVRAFVFKIARRRIADHHRKGRVETTPLGDLQAGGAESSGVGEIGVEGEEDLIGTEMVLDEAIGDLRPDHQLAVKLYVLLGCTAQETADQVRSRFQGSRDDPMSEQNVQQIGSRFRKDLRTRLEQAREGAVGR